MREPDKDFQWSADQTYARNFLQFWRTDWPRGRQVCAMAGYAGTGKTTVVADLISLFKGCAVCAPTGKAAAVLREKGCPDACTIHSLIYDAERDTNNKVRFVRRRNIAASTVVIDEASMVDRKVFGDVCSFGVPVLCVGDHGQLEPIGDNPNLMRNPDVRLEKIHRQAESSPIIRLATAFRQGRQVPYWRDPQERCAIVPRRDFSQHVMSGAQIICGFNKTRHAVNAQIRKERGWSSEITPCAGERIICLMNNAHYGIFNGQQAVVLDNTHVGGRCVDLFVRLDDGTETSIPCLREQFGTDKKLEYHVDKRATYWDYAYAITAHKSQGSEFDSVLVLEEISQNWCPQRWRYTVSTRAKSKLIYCK